MSIRQINNTFFRFKTIFFKQCCFQEMTLQYTNNTLIMPEFLYFQCRKFMFQDLTDF